MRVVTWNVNGRLDVTRQATAIAALEADLVTLQEITFSTTDKWRAALLASGYEAVASSFDFRPEPPVRLGPRRYGQMIACRGRIIAAGIRGSPWKERVLHADCRIQGEVVKVWTVHIPPGSSNGIVKVECLEGFLTSAGITTNGYRIVTGDFNTPQAELPTGEVVTWAQKRRTDGTWRLTGRGERWDRAEREVLTDLARGYLRDAFRTLHGYEREAFSWYWRGGTEPIGRRFDHIFASPTFDVLSCEYLHDLRTGGLSDHSALVADLRFAWQA